ncbi:MAG: hypothetical protein RLZZ453_1206 [Chlamydiota bacterium]|jgi:DNA repair ATPase RecN
MRTIDRFSLPSYIEQIAEEMQKPVTQDRYQELHKKLDEAFDRLQGVNQVDSLRDRMIELYGVLEENRSKEELNQIQRTAKRLETLIKKYKGDHLPTIEEKKTLRQASAILDQLKPDPESVDQVLDIARAVYNRDLHSAKKWFLSLGEALRDRFEEHLRSLKATPFKDRTETIQALMAISYELTDQKEPYPSQQEIDAFFLGIPSGESKIVDFNQLG